MVPENLLLMKNFDGEQRECILRQLGLSHCAVKKDCRGHIKIFDGLYVRSLSIGASIVYAPSNGHR